jgi:tRNA(fMet)-specific endonuclease VapC
MDYYLVDTSVVSIEFKSDSRATLYKHHLAARSLAISTVTRAELYEWSIGRKWGAERTKKLLNFLEKFAELEMDDEVLWCWARIRTEKGRPRSYSDSWIAATAIRYELPLVTHNRRDFEGIEGLDIISEERGGK